MVEPQTLTPEEMSAAREWWMKLPSEYKGRCSIWTILAMYAKHIQETLQKAS